MAETTDAAGAGHNKAPKSAEEHRQLLTHHMSKLREMLPQIEEVKGELKVLQEEFTARVNQAKADLGKGYSRKYLMGLLEDATSRLRDLMAEEERRARDREALGLPVFGVQADLFGAAGAGTPEEARDEVFWEAEGYMRGRNGAMEEIPDGTPPRFHQAVMRGFAAGQKATQDDFLAAQEIIKRRGEPQADAQPENLNEEEPEPGTPEAARKEREAVRKAKAGLDALGAREPAEEAA